MLVQKRRSVRLQNYDYSQPGAYFLTICTHDRKNLFGEVRDSEMRLNEFGNIVKNEWLKTFDIRPNVDLDEFVVMPNHFHGVVIINDGPESKYQPMGMTDPNSAAPRAPLISKMNMDPVAVGAPFMAPANGAQGAINRAPTLGSIVRTFKALSTYRIHKAGSHKFPVWQRNYHEHVVRGEKDLLQIQEYIQQNPLKWDLDPENPHRFLA